MKGERKRPEETGKRHGHMAIRIAAKEHLPPKEGGRGTERHPGGSRRNRTDT